MSRSTLIPSFFVCAAALLAAPAHGQTVNGLVAAYGFEEGSGTAIGDASGRNNNGVASGTTWSTAGKFGNALVFNGTNAARHRAKYSVAATDDGDDTRGVGLSDHGAYRVARDRRQDVDGYYLMASTGQRQSSGGRAAHGPTATRTSFGPSVLP
jgi:hypothetical protein